MNDRSTRLNMQNQPPDARVLRGVRGKDWGWRPLEFFYGGFEPYCRLAFVFLTFSLALCPLSTFASFSFCALTPRLFSLDSSTSSLPRVGWWFPCVVCVLAWFGGLGLLPPPLPPGASARAPLPSDVSQVGGDMELIKNAGVLGGAGDGGDDEDDVPDLVENFEEASKN